MSSACGPTRVVRVAVPHPAPVPAPTPDASRAAALEAPVNTYRGHVSSLAETYARARSADNHALSSALALTRGRQAIYVGSGGALAVARMGADIHEAESRTLARAATPLELIGMPRLHDPAAVLFTASARHPDAEAAVLAALRMQAQPVVVVTHRRREELSRAFAHSAVNVVTLVGGPPREGFLATHSVLAMATALLSATGTPPAADLPYLHRNDRISLRERVLVLGGPGLAAVQTDMETRLSETGLSAVQVTDYRNFAHGRHTGLDRRLHETTILALITPELRELAEMTLAALPESAQVLRIESKLPWPLCLPDLLVGSMKAVASAAERIGLDPARPQVPDYGRRLYHLSSRRLLPAQRNPVDRKLSAARIAETAALRARYADAHSDWLASAAHERFHGFVLDYDGTVCATEERYDLPGEALRTGLLRLLDGGIALGFASGRGSSLHRDLRRWIPEQHWHRVELGLYNGGEVLALTDDLAPAGHPAPDIGAAAERLQGTLPAPPARSTLREHQLSLEPNEATGLTLEALANIVVETLARPPRLELEVVVSGHSIDVVPRGLGKVRVLERVRSLCGGAVLAIGDQGQLGGNDFDLLAAAPWTLSVDRVSGDLTRCWNLDRRGERGPALLQRYLAALHPVRTGFALRWKR